VDIVEELATAKAKEETTSSLRAIDIRCRSIDHSRNFCMHQPEEDDGGTRRPAHTLSGSCSGWVALRREQQEQLERNHHENWTMGKEGKTNHSPRKRRNGGTPVGNVVYRPIARQHPACNNGSTVGGSVFYVVRSEAITRRTEFSSVRVGWWVVQRTGVQSLWAAAVRSW
jgi:hypothetical protein